MSTVQKVVVIKHEVRAKLPPEVLNRDFWMELRRSLLQQLTTIEKMLNIDRRCRNCGHDL